MALSAALTPVLLAAARAAYLALGGSLALGDVVSTLLRLLLSALVLLVPTLLMGGTLPAAARAVEGAGDARRRATALLYGANTLGAVAGSVLATFYGLERTLAAPSAALPRSDGGHVRFALPPPSTTSVRARLSSSMYA